MGKMANNIDMAKTGSATAKFGKGVLKRKIFIVEDHPIVREGLRKMIGHEPDMVVCGEADTPGVAIKLIPKIKPDLVLLDITLPQRSGLEVVKDLKALCPKLPILAISMHDELLYAERMLRAGANGYISKHQPADELLKAFRQVLEGQVYVSKAISDALLQKFSKTTRRQEAKMEILTDREFEVFQLLAEAKPIKEIARQLNLSAKTIAVHSSNIRRKLNLRSTVELVRFAIQSENLQAAKDNQKVPS